MQAGRLDDLHSAFGAKGRPDLLNPPVADEDVGVSERPIRNRQHGRPTNQEVTPPISGRKIDNRLGECRSREKKKRKE